MKSPDYLDSGEKEKFQSLPERVQYAAIHGQLSRTALRTALRLPPEYYPQLTERLKTGTMVKVVEVQQLIKEARIQQSIKHVAKLPKRLFAPFGFDDTFVERSQLEAALTAALNQFHHDPEIKISVHSFLLICQILHVENPYLKQVWSEAHAPPIQRPPEVPSPR